MQPDASRPRLSPSIEDYLKVIYALSEEGDAATTSRIAERLEVQPASVSGMLRRLASSDFLEHAPYRGVRLTEAGTREALKILRRHRVIETYLHRRLGFAWEEVHEEAERLEHVASDGLVERMAAALDDPTHDPHGSPIPDPSGFIGGDRWSRLSDPDLPHRVVVRAVPEDASGEVGALHRSGIGPGVMVEVRRGTALPDRVGLRVAGSAGPELAVDPTLADRILVSAQDEEGR